MPVVPGPRARTDCGRAHDLGLAGVGRRGDARAARRRRPLDVVVCCSARSDAGPAASAGPGREAGPRRARRLRRAQHAPRRRRPAGATPSPTSATSRSFTSRTSTRRCGTTADATVHVVEHGVARPRAALDRAAGPRCRRRQRAGAPRPRRRHRPRRAGRAATVPVDVYGMGLDRLREQVTARSRLAAPSDARRRPTCTRGWPSTAPTCTPTAGPASACRCWRR